MLSSRVPATPPMLADAPGLFDPLRVRGLDVSSILEAVSGHYPADAVNPEAWSRYEDSRR